MTMTHSGNESSPEGKPFTGRTVLFWLFGFFAVIFAANGVFIWLALGTFPGVVVESSYHAGQVYNEEIAVARAQADRGWKVAAKLERSPDGTASIRVDARDKLGAPLTGLSFVAELKHPIHEGQDVEIVMTEGESGIYTGNAGGLMAGNWNLVLEAESANERLFRSENRLFLSE